MWDINHWPHFGVVLWALFSFFLAHSGLYYVSGPTILERETEGFTREERKRVKVRELTITIQYVKALHIPFWRGSLNSSLWVTSWTVRSSISHITCGTHLIRKLLLWKLGECTFQTWKGVNGGVLLTTSPTLHPPPPPSFLDIPTPSPLFVMWPRSVPDHTASEKARWRQEFAADVRTCRYVCEDRRVSERIRLSWQPFLNNHIVVVISEKTNYRQLTKEDSGCAKILFR